MSQPSADAKAVVRAAEALTTQVRRIADALSTPVVRYEVAADDDATTDDDGTCQLVTVDGEQLRVLGIGDFTDQEQEFVADIVRAAKQKHAAEHGPDFTSPLAGNIEVRRPCPYCGDRQMIPRHQFDEHVARLHPDVRASPADDEEPPSWERRKSLAVLLSRAQRGVTPLTSEESDLLRRHVETEIREANTARAVAAGNKRHVQVMYEELEREQAASKGLAGKIKEQRSALDVMRAELTAAQAAIERVRKALDDRPPCFDGKTGQPASSYEAGWRDHDRMVRAALDGTEQPTTEEPS